MSFTFQNPFAYFNNPANSNPVGLGLLYIGLSDTNPEIPSNQVQVYAVQPDGSELAIPQPVMMLAGGVPSHNGSPVQIKISNPQVSVKITNTIGGQVYYTARYGAAVSASALAGPSSEVLIAGVEAADIVLAMQKSDIRLFGAPSLDIADLIQAALTATGAAYVPSGTYEHKGGTVSLQDNQHIFFGGVTINKTAGSDVSMISVFAKSYWSITGVCNYFGTRVAETVQNNENYIDVQGGRAFKIENQTANNCRGLGLWFRAGVGAGGVRGERGQINNCATYGCWRGLETAPAATAEYLVFTNFNACGNYYGIKDGAGNSNFSGGNCVDNTITGFWVVGDYANNAHGSCTGMNINHNGDYNIHCQNVTQGYTFTGCHLFGNAIGSSSGAVFIENSKGITINGGIIDCWIYNYDGANAGLNYITDVYMPGGYGDVVTRDAALARPEDLIITNCYGAGAYQAGVSINDPSFCYVAAFRNAGDTQAITSGVLTDLSYPTVQANGDRRRAFDGVTFTVPVGQDGQYRISVVDVFGGSSLVASTSYIDIVTSAGNRILGAVDNGGVLLSMSGTMDVYLSAGQTVKTQTVINGTSPVFAAASYGCGLSIERIS